MTNSPRKGKTGELEAAKALRDLLGLPATRGARNGVAGGEDIMGVPGVHFEVKRRRRLAVTEFVMQAHEDARIGEIPVVLMRQDEGRWLVVVDLEDLIPLGQRLSQARTLP